MRPHFKRLVPIVVRLKTASVILRVQFYVSINAASDEEIEEFYDNLRKMLRLIPKDDIGSAEVEQLDKDNRHNGIAGSHDLGTRNKCEEGFQLCAD